MHFSDVEFNFYCRFDGWVIYMLFAKKNKKIKELEEEIELYRKISFDLNKKNFNLENEIKKLSKDKKESFDKNEVDFITENYLYFGKVKTVTFKQDGEIIIVMDKKGVI